MRKTALSLLAGLPLLAVAASTPPAFAQEHGALVVDGFAAPEAALGFGYYFTDRLSLRPSFGFAHSSSYGDSYWIGSSLRYYYFRPQLRLAPYVEAQAAYVHNQTVPRDAFDPSPGFEIRPHSARFGLGAGLRYRLGGRFALFTEARVTHSTCRYGLEPGSRDWGRIRLNDRDRAEFVLGITFTLKSGGTATTHSR
jgi:hypothetical protein